MWVWEGGFVARKFVFFLFGKCGERRGRLVERPATVLCSTQARDLVLLQREFVVVGDLFVDGDGLLGVDHNLLLGLYGDDLGVTIRSAAVVDESCQVATLGGVYDGVVVHSEQVAAADALLCVTLLSIVSHHLSDVLTHILYDHLIRRNGLHGEQAPFVDSTASKTKLLLTELELVEFEQVRVHDSWSADDSEEAALL